MRVLTPVHLHLGAQVSPLAALHLPIVPSSTTWRARSSFFTTTSTWSVSFRLRHVLAGSSQRPAETGSLYYRPTVRLRLLPTPSHDDAVSFGYRAVVYPDTDFHRADEMPSRAY